MKAPDLNRQLLMEFKAGSFKAFEQFYHRNKATLFGYIRVREKRQSEAEDILQEVFMLVCKKTDLFIAADDCKAYMLKTASNMILERGRKSIKETEKKENVKAAGLLQHKSDASSIEDGEERVKVEEALIGLSPELREVILLHEFSDLSFPSIARFLDISQSTVYERYKKALASLKKLISKPK